MAPEAPRLRGRVHPAHGDPAETVKRRDLIERCYDFTAKGNKSASTMALQIVVENSGNHRK